MNSIAIRESRGAISRASGALLFVFVLTLFLSSVLMFVLEPMAAKMVLPLLGGAPAVWNTCVVFFQAMLLAGYAYAHGGPALLGVRRHAALHILLATIPLFFLPFAIESGSSAAADDPIAWLLLLLLTTIGLPFFVLTATAPLLQKWLSRTDHPTASDPYFLYAASNIGSLLGLLAYPSIVEPILRLRDQAYFWTIGYGIFAGLVIVCAVFLWRRPLNRLANEAADPQDIAAPLGVMRRLRWVVLSFAPSSLTLAVTTFVSTDIASVPLLWIVPLSLYLLSFIVAFSSRQGYPRALVDRAFPLLILPLVFLMILRTTGPMAVVLPVHLLFLFVAALLCHRALADDRPAAAQLTEFYLWVAFGGVLGSLFNTLVAPVIFTGIAEYPLVLLLVCLIRDVPPARTEDGRSWLPVALAVSAGLLSLAIILRGPREPLTLRFALLAVPAFLCLRVSRLRVPFALAIALVLLASVFEQDQQGKVIEAERTFFGTYRVTLDETGTYRSLFHGTTLHGMQSLLPARRHEPLTYYHPTGPFGELFRGIRTASRHERIGVVGLGVGSLAAYRRGQQHWTFYEVDPAVERIARNPELFTFLPDCGSGCDVVLGDARQSLTLFEGGPYGLIVLDAFSSDAIPVHLLTQEALGVYFRRLAPGGVLAFHISNRHLNLEPVLARLAAQLNLSALIRKDRTTRENSPDGKSSSDWLVLARELPDLGSLAGDGRWSRPYAPANVRLWTDDFSNILSVLLTR